MTGREARARVKRNVYDSGHARPPNSVAESCAQSLPVLPLLRTAWEKAEVCETSVCNDCVTGTYGTGPYKRVDCMSLPRVTPLLEQGRAMPDPAAADETRTNYGNVTCNMFVVRI